MHRLDGITVANNKKWEGSMAFYRAWMTAPAVLPSITIAAGSATAQKKYDLGVTEEPSKFT
jgi:hypothetical protein